MAAIKPHTWLDYISTVQQRNFSKEDLNVEGIERILNLNQQFHSVFNYSIPWIYLLDYTTGKYLLISKSMKLMLGYEPESFLNNGLGFTVEIYEKNHLRLLNEEIFPDKLEFLKKVPPHEHPDYVFSHNLDIETKKGEMMSLLQRSCFIKSDGKGNPLMSFGVITNINHFGSGSPVRQVIEKVSKDGFAEKTELVWKKSYYLNEEDKIFTKRERELLSSMADGLTSKAIADKLFISENTVINHRRNMQEKSNTKNVAELISFAIRQRLI
ncbi:MAG: response regulator transcription factor [Bacteroidetes bacterium]|nr:response regulator transcription factor [Bacteroidota bacterium]MBS1607428.1 response regulator transcription factor [Bacteroidota bacterium]